MARTTREEAREIARLAERDREMTTDGHLRSLYVLVGRLADVMAEEADKPLLTVKGVTVRESDVERTVMVCRYDKLRAKVASIIAQPGIPRFAGPVELTDEEWMADQILKSLTEVDLAVLEDLHDLHEEN